MSDKDAGKKNSRKTDKEVKGVSNMQRRTWDNEEFSRRAEERIRREEELNSRPEEFPEAPGSEQKCLSVC
jgi:hypothetical protein